MKKYFSYLVMGRILTLSFLLTGCGICPDKIDHGKITSINIIDRNGMSETISSKERLGAFNNTDFLAPQPYQKVLRVYGNSNNGQVSSCITSYHPNGQIKQYLEALNNRAFGAYREWHPNGTCKVDAYVIGGSADINTNAEQSWVFDGTSRAWNDEESLIAEIQYKKGELEGVSTYYHPNGKVWKISPYSKNTLHGTQITYLEDGTTFQTTTYENGLKHGASVRYWQGGEIAFEEEYQKGELNFATYYTPFGASIASIQNGSGHRAVFGKTELLELQEFKNGKQDGIVKVYENGTTLIATYTMKDGEKQGEELNYFPGTEHPKLLLNWHGGILQGAVKTWHENGQLESHREMSENQKNGLLTAWYRNGSLMLVEEYEKDKLQKGEYFRMGERHAASKVEKGSGVATLFNSEGNFSRKVYYHDGTPVQ